MSAKGYKHTEEARQRISAARRKRMAEDGYLNSAETRRKISEGNRGRHNPSEETRKKIGEASRRWTRSPEHIKKFTDAGHAAMRGRTDERSSNWGGNDIGKYGLSQWVKRKLGKPLMCEECGTSSAKKYHWISVSGVPKRDLSDWTRLCCSCHWDRLHRIPWNKGKHSGTPKSAFKKGQVQDNGHRFKPGLVPHNKGKAMPEIAGPNHPNWKGGVAPVHQMIRASIPYKQWRMAVFERDHFTCVMCGFRSRYHGRGKCDIRADHIKPFHQYPELRFDVDNGRTLCVPCDLQHGWQPWRKTEDTDMAGQAQLIGLVGKET